MRSLNQPTGDLCEMLRVNEVDARDAGIKPCSASNRQLRLFVAAWMLEDELGFKAAGYEALALYEDNRPGLIDKPGYLTDAAIAREVMMLVDLGESQ